jgi:hypothetical protein
MHPNQAAVNLFLGAQKDRDPIRLQNAVREDVVLQDPLFGELKGAQAFAMWQMLWRFREYSVTVDEQAASPTEGKAEWRQTYNLPATRRMILNKVTSSFTFYDRRISAITDKWSLYGYARMGQGALGLLLGWLPPFQETMRQAALERLTLFIGEHSIDAGNFVLERPESAAAKKRSRIPRIDAEVVN